MSVLLNCSIDDAVSLNGFKVVILTRKLTKRDCKHPINTDGYRTLFLRKKKGDVLYFNHTHIVNEYFDKNQHGLVQIDPYEKSPYCLIPKNAFNFKTSHD